MAEIETNVSSTISLPLYPSDLWRGLCKFWKQLLIMNILTVSAFFLISSFHAPHSTAAATITILLADSTDASAEYGFNYSWSAAERLPSTVDYLLADAYLKEDICSICGFSTFPAALRSKFVAETNMFTIYASADDSKTALAVLHALLDLLPAAAEPIIGNSTLSIISEPTLLAEQDLSENCIRYLLFGLVTGFLLSVCFLMLYALLRKTIRTKEDIVKHLGIPCAGVLPNPKEDTLIYHSTLQMVLTNKFQSPGTVCLITGTKQEEDIHKMTTDLAEEAARNGRQVLHLLSDANDLPEKAADLFQYFHALRNQYDLILLEAPACSISADAELFARFSDQILYVIRQDTAFINDISRCITALTRNSSSEISCMLTGISYGISGYGACRPYTSQQPITKE